MKPSPRPTAPLGQTEFVALMAMLGATVAFSIDAILPALPDIGAELSPTDPNRVQLIVISFVFGLGIGTFLAGPLSDRFGRKPVVVGGALIYILGASLAYLAQSLEWMLLARAVQGFGGAGPRIASLAMIRDLHAGRGMARILSFVMVVFTIVPAIAPTLGAGIIYAFGWRAVYLAFILFTTATVIWMQLRQPETLAPALRNPLRLSAMVSATGEVLRNPTSRLSIIAQTLSYGMLFLTISSTQQVFDLTYGRGTHFHYWFGVIAVVAATASVVNARIVVQLGMRAIVRVTFLIQMALSVVMVAAILLPLPLNVEFAIYVLWTLSLFYQAGLTVGNLNALALEPMGHIAGLAASITAGISTLGATMLVIPVSLMFDNSAMPMALACIIYAGAAASITTKIRRESDPD